MTPDEVGRLPRDESIVLISGTYPLKGAKYRIEEHPSYPEVDPGHAGEASSVSTRPFRWEAVMRP